MEEKKRPSVFDAINDPSQKLYSLRIFSKEGKIFYSEKTLFVWCEQLNTLRGFNRLADITRLEVSSKEEEEKNTDGSITANELDELHLEYASNIIETFLRQHHDKNTTCISKLNINELIEYLDMIIYLGYDDLVESAISYIFNSRPILVDSGRFHDILNVSYRYHKQKFMNVILRNMDTKVLEDLGFSNLSNISEIKGLTQVEKNSMTISLFVKRIISKLDTMSSIISNKQNTNGSATSHSYYTVASLLQEIVIPFDDNKKVKQIEVVDIAKKSINICSIKSDGRCYKAATCLLIYSFEDEILNVCSLCFRQQVKEKLNELL
jgi:hypothetical protein